MNPKQIQSDLTQVYNDWRGRLCISKDDQASLSPPLLLCVSEEYCESEIRVIVFGQETYGWSWNKELCEDFPNYPISWPFGDINALQDFLSNSDSIAGLCWGYREFRFAERQPVTRRSPFWQAFREVQRWPEAGVMWSNMVRSDFEGGSVLRAPPQLQKALTDAQADLLAAELAILKPHVCLFLTGPYYDPLITDTLPGCEFLPVDNFPTRQIAALAHPLLPPASFRTYHPRYLSQGGCWDYIKRIQQKAYATLEKRVAS